MTYTELQKKITHLETELTEVKEKVEELKNSIDDGGVFKPEDGEEYWFISDDGDTDYSHWVDTRFDEGRYAIGNCYSTRQSAEDAVRALKLVQKARESQGDFVADWESAVQKKFYLYFYDNGIRTGSNFLMNTTPIFGYWKDKSACEEFIDENRKELLWFFTEYRR